MSKVTKIVAMAAVVGVIGVAALPVASYAVTQTDAVTVQVQITDGLSLACDENYTHSYGAASNATDSTGSASNANHGTCTVISNVAAGYDLTVADTDANTSLVSGANTIPTLATHAAGTPGWAVDYSTSAGSTTLTGTRKAMPAAGAGLSIASPTAVSAGTGDTYDYAFSSSIAANTPAGTYADEVTFTVISK
jgi:hypothetical protein